MMEIKFRAMINKAFGGTEGYEGLWVYINGIGHDQWYSMNGRFYGEVKDQTKG